MEKSGIIIAIEAIGDRITSLEKHFSNHVSQHTIDKVIRLIELLIIIIMFCFLKWGTVQIRNKTNKIENNEKNYIEELIVKTNRVEKTGGI